jgi:hypothetical protein
MDGAEELNFAETRKTFYPIAQKFGYALLGGLLFLLLANPTGYQWMRVIVNKLTGSQLGDWIANEHGCANFVGLLFHAVLFVTAIFLLMVFWDEKYATSAQDDKPSEPASAPSEPSSTE